MIDDVQAAIAGPIEPVDEREASAAKVQALWADISRYPHRQELFQVMRRIASAYPQLPKFGQALRPSDEPLRITQEATLTFAPSAVSAVQIAPGALPRLMQRVFGLLGPNGPLPIHMTEQARERQMHHADPTLLRFLDMLTHRFAMQFYAAWAQAQPVVSLDRPGDSLHSAIVGSLFGLGNAASFARDPVGDYPKLYFAGRLSRSVRDAEGLQAWISSQFKVPVAIEPWSGHWMTLEPLDRSRLLRRGALGLGRGVALGSRVWDVQHKFRIVVGALDWNQYAEFVPGGSALPALLALVRQYVGFEFEWDVRVILRREQVPSLQLSSDPRRIGARIGALGQSTWLSTSKRLRDAGDYVVNVENTRAARHGAAC